MRIARHALLALAVLAIAVAATSSPDGARSADGVSVRASVDATLVPPMVAFRLRDGNGRALAPADEGLADVLGDLPGLAVLDTGASAHLLSHDTAARYGVRADTGARWIETGMSGEHALGVSAPYTVALDAHAADTTETADTRGHHPSTHAATATPALLLPSQRLLLNDVPETAETMLASPGAVVDVIGMPALEHTVVELRASDVTFAVTVLPSDADARADHWLPLALVDFNHRRNPANRGAPPTLASNPVLRGVRVVRGGRSARGDWLVDTGSAVTLLSTATAHALGLTEPALLSAPVGGISGAQQSLPGWRVDRIELATTAGDVVTLTDAAVFVHDVTTTSDDGVHTTLDGIVGANLLQAFARVVIDVPHARLGIDVGSGTEAGGR